MADFISSRILIIGGGTAGICIAARLARLGLASQVTIVEPSEQHWYQPLWTLVAGGVSQMSQSVRPTKEYIPNGVQWIKDSVASVSAAGKQVVLVSGQTLPFDWLVVATGLEMNWDSVKGSKEALESPYVCSIYSRNHVEKTRELLNSTGAGNFLFTFPPPPIKCAGAPQKIMYLADEILQRKNVRSSSKIIYRSALPSIFGIPVFADVLMKIIKRKNIEVHFKQKCIEVLPQEKTAVFADVETNEIVAREKYDFLHLVPSMRAHQFIRESDLCPASGPEAGWVDVNPATMQHKRFNYVFSLGDVCSAPNAKTGAAVRKQAPVLVRNMLAAMHSQRLAATYDGYASCPLVTGFGKVVLAEFGYEGKLMPTFPGNPARESLLMWWMKVRLLPILYWKFMLRGLA
jgi:sulfide:quinone oxidoreductase